MSPKGAKTSVIAMLITSLILFRGSRYRQEEVFQRRQEEVIAFSYILVTTQSRLRDVTFTALNRDIHSHLQRRDERSDGDEENDQDSIYLKRGYQNGALFSWSLI